MLVMKYNVIHNQNVVKMTILSYRWNLLKDMSCDMEYHNLLTF